MYQISPTSKRIRPLTVKSFSELGFTERYDLQEWISHEPESLDEELLIIQKEFDGFGQALNYKNLTVPLGDAL